MYRELARATLSILVLVVALTACGAPRPSANLDGTEWVLQSVDGSSPLAGTEITLAFSGGQASGSAGCNTYAGPYSVEGEDGLSFSGLANTEMACLEPVGIMDQEEKYLEALRAATGFRLSDGELQIFSAEGAVLVYSRAQ